MQVQWRRLCPGLGSVLSGCLALLAACGTPTPFASAPGEPSVVAASPTTTSGAPAELVVWSSQRKLTWADFSGAVPNDKLQASIRDHLLSGMGVAQGDHEAAQTASVLPGASYSYSYSCTTTARSSTSTCSVQKFDPAPVQAAFDPNRSWVIQSDESPALLAHEQGHFDIAAVHARMLNDALARLATQGLADLQVSGMSADVATASLKAVLSTRVARLQDSVARGFAAQEELYDQQTNHGTNAAVQEQWAERLAAELKDPAR